MNITNRDKKQITIDEICKNILFKAFQNKFKGIDPYDGINTKIFSSRFNPKISKIILTQFAKLFPLNLRKIFGIRDHLNPKCVAVFLLGLYEENEFYTREELSFYKTYCFDLLFKNSIKFERNNKIYLGWGYPFYWQSRTFFQEKNEILVVPSCYVAKALFQEKNKYINELTWLANYFKDYLNRKKITDSSIGFSYGKNDKSTIYNVSALVGEFFFHYSKLMFELGKSDWEKYKDIAFSAISFVASSQNPDGSWYYGPDENQKWIDCIHTIYNLQGLFCFSEKFDSVIRIGIQYLLNNFIGKNSDILNFSNKNYPQEAHSSAAFICFYIELLQSEYSSFVDITLLPKLVNRFIENYYDKEVNKFYYRKSSWGTNKIEYIRWSNSFGFYCLNKYLKYFEFDPLKKYIMSNILGINVLNVTKDQTVNIIQDSILANKKISQYSLNLNKIVEIKKDKNIEDIFKRSEIVSPDGFPVVLLSRLNRFSLIERVAGVDLFLSLLERANDNNWRCCFLGSTQENIEVMKKVVKKKYPNIESLFFNGYFKKEGEEYIVSEINKFLPQFLFLGLSSPKKEIFMDEYKERLQVNLLMGVGGSFDILTGKTKRAPQWMQKFGLEWFFRMIQEPSRMVSRYSIGLIEFCIILFKKELRGSFEKK